MAAISFENVPITIRERVYDELLTFSTNQSTVRGRAPSSALSKLVFLNRQIHAEIINFLRRQLPVLIKTNDPEFVKKILGERKGVQIISQLRSEDGAISKQIAESLTSMELEMYMYHNHLDATSFAAFLLPASSIKELLGQLWLPAWTMWTMQASASFKLTNTFSYTQEAALSKLVQPWIDWFVAQHFVGVSAGPALPPELSSQLTKRLLGDYPASGHLQKIQSLAHYGGAERAQVGDWKGATERFSMAERYTKLVWDCHLECMKLESGVETGRDLVRQAWLMTSSVIANHVQCLINAAVDLGAPVKTLEVQIESGDKVRLQEARTVAETGICFMRSLPTRNNDNIEKEEEVQNRKIKAKLSFRAHLACKALGDVHAAIGYLQEAKKYEPESAVMLDADMNALRVEGEKRPKYEGGNAIVLWESC